MSDTDSFIEEVSEEVRKDQLYGYLRKYGWIGGALVVLIVGGAVYSEWSNHRAAVDAQTRGDALTDALNKPTVTEQIAALDNISANPVDATDILGFQRAAILAEDGQIDTALALLNAIANDETAKQVYRDMARFKAVVLSGNDIDQGERMAALEVLAKPGNAFRPLALEQIAIAKLDAGDESGAIEQLTQLLNEPAISADLRRRSAQLLVSLGGEIPAVAQLLSGSEAAQ